MLVLASVTHMFSLLLLRVVVVLEGQSSLVHWVAGLRHMGLDLAVRAAHGRLNKGLEIALS